MARASTRAKRTPLNEGYRNKLKVYGGEPGYSYRFVNDLDNRVEMFKENGWEVVTDASVKIGDKRVATPTAEGTPKSVYVGNETTAYLMRIKQEWYDEDQEAKKQEVDEIERSLKSQDGFTGKVSIE